MPARKKMTGKGLMDALRYIKDNKLISKGLGIIPHPYAQGGSYIAKLAGLGKRRKKAPKRKMKGRGFFSDLGAGLGSVAGGLGGGIGSAFNGIGHGIGGAIRGTGKRHKKVILI
jgi:hypothetical protein